MAPAAGRRPPQAPPLVAIVGPTASGKSQLAMAMARRLPLEILVADSRQVYRGMDVGTAKPGLAERAAVPHHLLDLVNPDEPFSVARWLEEARALLPEIAGRGSIPAVVGGTGLYVAALLDGFDLARQGWDPEIRHALVRELEAGGLEPLAAQLARLDPEAATRTDLRNPRRVLRALERVRAGDTSGPPVARPYPGRVAVLGIARPRAVLYRRIDERARRLFSGGLLTEVAGLLSAGYAPTLTPMTAHGYAEAIRHLAGDWTLDVAVETTARRTRQYAKRQLSWFRRDRRIVWLPAGDRAGDDPALVEMAVDLIRRLTS